MLQKFIRRHHTSSGFSTLTDTLNVCNPLWNALNLTSAALSRPHFQPCNDIFLQPWAYCLVPLRDHTIILILCCIGRKYVFFLGWKTYRWSVLRERLLKNDRQTVQCTAIKRTSTTHAHVVTYSVSSWAAPGRVRTRTRNLHRPTTVSKRGMRRSSRILTTGCSRRGATCARIQDRKTRPVRPTVNTRVIRAAFLPFVLCPVGDTNTYNSAPPCKCPVEGVIKSKRSKLTVFHEHVELDF